MTALRTRRARPASRALESEQRTIVLIRVLLGFESVLYSVLTPVLPHYAHAFGASKTAIGVLAASVSGRDRDHPRQAAPPDAPARDSLDEPQAVQHNDV